MGAEFNNFTTGERVVMYYIAKVVLSNSTREFDREYHYRVPPEFADRVVPGIRVIVPFGKANRSLESYVIDVIKDTDLAELKDIKSVVDETPVMTRKMIELCKWMKERYICTYSDAIRCMLPPGIGLKSTCYVRLLRQGPETIGSPKKILDVLADYGGECEIDELKSHLDIRNFMKHLKFLEDSGFISIYEEFTSRVKEKTIRVAYLAMPREDVINDIENNRIKKIQQIRILEMLLDNEHISVSDILRFSGVSASVLDTLRKYGYVNFKDINVSRDPLKHRSIERTEHLKLTSQQSMVLESLKGQLDKGAFSENLLHGVTGSGKTEVYLQLIKHCIDKNKQAIVLVPEISLTPQMVERFKGRFEDDVAVLHSRLSLGERFDQWRLIREAKIKVVVGARSAVFAPFENLGLIIIDEEHENSYKSEITPKYHARDVARERGMRENAVILYGSATPAVETYYAARNRRINLLKMDERANNMMLPVVEIVDMRRELEEGNRSVFSRRLIDEINSNIGKGQQTILFLNRRGYASFVLCRSCGYTLKCVNCNISMTYHASDNRLICHYCGYTTKNPSFCPKCKSTYIKQFGAGTQKIEEEIRKQFPGCSVIRMDADTTNYKNSHEEILRTFKEENINIMVGTQMIAKGHDFPNVTLVGVLAADSLLNMGDYTSSERTFQLLTQVAGRAGRGEIPGRVIIQSYNIEDFSIQAACKHDYTAFYNQEISVRRALNYPPFTNIASVMLSGTIDRLVFNKSKEMKDIIAGKMSGCESSIDILGPTRAPLSKIKSKYRWRIIIKCSDLNKLITVLSAASDEFCAKKDLVDLNIDINPLNML